MICVVIKGPTYQNAVLQIQKAMLYGQLIELRLDYFDYIDLKELIALQNQFALPMILTLRSIAEGGSYAGSKERQFEILKELASLNPKYIDIEEHLGKSKIEKLIALHPHIHWIISSHSNASFDLASIVDRPNVFYKKVKAIQTSVEGLEFLELNQKFAGRGLFIGSGSLGLPTRVLAPVFKAPFTYAALSEHDIVSPGQPLAEELQKKYRLATLHPKTHLFGLLGFPVEHSLSDWTHNQLIHKLNLEAIYVKFPLQKEELGAFLAKSKMMGFKGFSVTMPLKEMVMPHLEWIEENAFKIGAVNTIHFHEGLTKGSNTDGIGALNAIEKHMSSKNLAIILMGAGGAAKAVAYEAVRRGAKVTVLSRLPAKTESAFHKIGCQVDSLDSLKRYEYDLLINATPDPCPIEEQFIQPKKAAMDLKSRPKMSLFLQKAQQKDNKIIYGYEMFVEQAIEQFSTWFPGLDKHKCHEALHQALTLFK